LNCTERYAAALGGADQPEYTKHSVPDDSVVILRNFGTGKVEDQQSFIPTRFLRGLIPDVLLNDFMFWQNADDSLIGYQRPETREKTQTAYVLRVYLNKEGVSFASARVTRVNIGTPKAITGPVDQAQWEEERELKSPEEYTLLNILYAPEGTFLSELSEYFVRIEDLTQVLVWTKGKPDGKTGECTVDLIELPRFQISFSAKTDLDGVTRLYSSDHVGMFISQSWNPMADKLLMGIPHAVVLESMDGEFAFMVPSTLPTKLKVINSRFRVSFYHDRSRDIVLTYYYPIHLSNSFLFTPTLESAMYLLLIRMIHGQFEDAIRLVDSCLSDSLSGEATEIWERLQKEDEDRNPDAEALRLRLYLVALDGGYNCSWNLVDQLFAYVSRLGNISAVCRLSPQQEHKLLTMSGSKSALLTTRLAYLTSILTKTDSFRPTFADRPSIQEQFDLLVDKTCSVSQDDSFFSKFSKVSYKRPPELSGAQAASSLNKYFLFFSLSSCRACKSSYLR
jgi:hypothetical protein